MGGLGGRVGGKKASKVDFFVHNTVQDKSASARTQIHDCGRRKLIGKIKNEFYEFILTELVWIKMSSTELK